jgi:hypothetical protein
VYGEYAESIEASMKNTTKLGLFAVFKIVSEYAESIKTYSENTQKLLGSYGEKAKRIFDQHQKNILDLT